jgi:Short C-terminal domain/Phospholipase_D-nuclease N-terminal
VVERRRDSVLAYTYPLLSIFWTLLELAVFVLWVWLLISIFADIFLSHDLTGLEKALWVIFLVVLPILGVLVYLIARGGAMHERAQARARQQQERFDVYVRHAASTSATDEVAKLAALRDSGAITDEEYQRLKARLLV